MGNILFWVGLGWMGLGLLNIALGFGRVLEASPVALQSAVQLWMFMSLFNLAAFVLPGLVVAAIGKHISKPSSRLA